MTVNEFLNLKNICEPRRNLNLQYLTDDIINEAMKRIPSIHGTRLNMAKNIPQYIWPTLIFPRKDGLANIKPNGIFNAVRIAFWHLLCEVERVAKDEGNPELIEVSLNKDGTVICPRCLTILRILEG